MSREKRSAKKFGEEEYVLVQFIEDDVKMIMTSKEVRLKKDGGHEAMYTDNKFYSCLVLSRSDEKETLMKIKATVDKNNQEKRRNKAKKNMPPAKKSKPVTVHNKASLPNELKEKSKLEKDKQKKALDERDFSVLRKMSAMLQTSEATTAVPNLPSISKSSYQQTQKDMHAHMPTVATGIKKGAPKRKLTFQISKDFECPQPVYARSGSACSEDGSDSDAVDIPSDFGLSGSEHSPVTKVRPICRGKRPRMRPLGGERLPFSKCSECIEKDAEITTLMGQNQSLVELINQLRNEDSHAVSGTPPRPGKLAEETAQQYQMVELSPGMRVYCFESHITKAASKPTATATACFLLSCFYTDKELMGTNLTGKNGKRAIDSTIIDGILSYTRKRFPAFPESQVKGALRNKISCLETRARKVVTLGTA